MFMTYEMLVLALTALVAPLFARYAGYELRRKPFELVGGAGLFFMLAAAFGLAPFQGTFFSGIWYVAGIVSYFIGWLGLLIGAIWELVDVLSISEAHEHTGA
jgi:hypothetical protein